MNYEDIRVGDKFIINENVDDYEKGKSKKRVEYTVVEKYTRHVLCRNNKGSKRCISINELVQYGYIVQEDEFEGMRRREVINER